LTKQLTHCESDLQANIDLVNTLESALNDSERNLRKARTQMNDLAKERDTFLGQNDALRQQIQDAHTEVETVRHSV
jgi:capsule polysaccharide export protein KpsE/RkpR